MNEFRILMIKNQPMRSRPSSPKKVLLTLSYRYHPVMIIIQALLQRSNQKTYLFQIRPRTLRIKGKIYHTFLINLISKLLGRKGLEKELLTISFSKLNIVI